MIKQMTFYQKLLSYSSLLFVVVWAIWFVFEYIYLYSSK